MNEEMWLSVAPLRIEMETEFCETELDKIHEEIEKMGLLHMSLARAMQFSESVSIRMADDDSKTLWEMRDGTINIYVQPEMVMKEMIAISGTDIVVYHTLSDEFASGVELGHEFGIRLMMHWSKRRITELKRMGAVFESKSIDAQYSITRKLRDAIIRAHWSAYHQGLGDKVSGALRTVYMRNDELNYVLERMCGPAPDDGWELSDGWRYSPSGVFTHDKIGAPLRAMDWKGLGEDRAKMASANGFLRSIGALMKMIGGE